MVAYLDAPHVIVSGKREARALTHYMRRTDHV